MNKSHLSRRMFGIPKVSEEIEIIEEGSSSDLKFFNPENRLVTLTEEIDNRTAMKVIDDLYLAEATEDAPVVLIINSPGGSAYSTLSIVDAIQAMSVPVIGLTMGLAASGGFYAFQACTHRVMLKNSILFWHEMIHMDDGLIRTGGEAEKRMKDYKKLNDHILTFFKKKINISAENWKKTFENRNDLSFNSTEAIRAGLADKAIVKMSQLSVYFKAYEKAKGKK